MGECDGEIAGKIKKNPFSFKATLSVSKELLCSGQGTSRVRAPASVSLGPWEGQLPKKGKFCFSHGAGQGCTGREMREREGSHIGE